MLAGLSIGIRKKRYPKYEDVMNELREEQNYLALAKSCLADDESVHSFQLFLDDLEKGKLTVDQCDVSNVLKTINEIRHLPDDSESELVFTDRIAISDLWEIPIVNQRVFAGWQNIF